jgi:glycosyltransferase involved in cell wall biosynthesis
LHAEFPVDSSAHAVEISAVIPCLNEEQTIGICIEKALDSFARMGLVGEVVVADNGSTDRSIEIARRLGARVVHEERKGYGAALLKGITQANGEINVMADADEWLAPFEIIMTYSKRRITYRSPPGRAARRGSHPGNRTGTRAADIGGVYLGIHFLAFGALLTLVGFNIVNLGVLTNTLMAQRYTRLRSRTARFVQKRFVFELGLLTNIILVSIGTAIDILIASRWISIPGAPMQETVHLAFVATTALVLGLNLVFSSFLLKVILAADRR